MQLLLIRHAIAEEREDFAVTGRDDSERPLTEPGQRRMEKNALGLQRISPKPDLIASSPYVRAKQTAEIVATALGIETPTFTDTLTPESHPKEFFAWLANQPADAVVIAVGHEPNISRLLQWATVAKADSRAEFKKGGAALVDFDGAAAAGEGMLRWLVTPSQLRSIAT